MESTKMGRRFLLVLTATIGLVPTAVAGQRPDARPAVVRRAPTRSIVILQPFGFYPSFSSLAPIYPRPIHAMPVAPIYSLPMGTLAFYATGLELSALNRNEQLTYEVHRLTRELKRLRQKKTSQQSLQVPSPAASPEPITSTEPRMPTVVIFLDGRRQEIRNYAIAEETLWVFDEQPVRRIPLSALDLAATRKENPRFRVPEQ